MSNLKQIDNPSINIKVKLLVTLGENNIYLLSQNAKQFIQEGKGRGTQRQELK